MGNPAHETRMQHLVYQHRELDRELTYLVRRAYLTPDEQTRMAQLKKLKLNAKDQIAALQQVLAAS